MSHGAANPLPEQEEDAAVVESKVVAVAELMKTARHPVVFTGAGVSTSAGIPDFRGPNGQWTLLDQGRVAELKPWGERGKLPSPTLGHILIKKMVDSGLVKFVITQNVDGLHLMSGIPYDKLAELHGSKYKLYCSKCGAGYAPPPFSDPPNLAEMPHMACFKPGVDDPDDFGVFGELIGVGFGQNLPRSELELATHHSKLSDLVIVLGSSLQVTPACNLVEYSFATNGGHLVIVNLQPTPFDSVAHTVIRCRTDHFMQRLSSLLGITP
ncbi:NAD-dependent protein deacetylase sirtuin-6 [Pelomyxa schiedti]|nr:NAD-dependent protein deacetylase sirtuin-6 [Pelomyxa schiedti]